jgi:Ran GTPase-activating protein (RanGAP) involved in mRNA processing and transport
MGCSFGGCPCFRGIRRHTTSTAMMRQVLAVVNSSMCQAARSFSSSCVSLCQFKSQSNGFLQKRISLYYPTRNTLQLNKMTDADADLVLCVSDHVRDPTLPVTEAMMKNVVSEFYRKRFAAFPDNKPKIEIDCEGVTLQICSSRVLASFIDLNSDLVVAINLTGITTNWKDAIVVHENVYKNLGESLRKCPLVKVDFSEMGHPNECLHFVLGAFSKTTLRNVTIMDSFFGAKEMKSLAQVLTNVVPGTTVCPANFLTHFIISRSNAGQEGASCMKAILRNCHSLIKFEYADCNPGIEGSMAIAEGLFFLSENSASLEILNLQGSTYIYDEAFDTLCSAIHKLTNLTDVNLSYCQLSGSKQFKLKKIVKKREGLSLVYDFNEGVDSSITTMTQDI